MHDWHPYQNNGEGITITILQICHCRQIWYFQLHKALYGMLKSALLFYRKLVANLLAMGFTLPYDPCVANKTIHGTQMTVCWHMDDLKISHDSKSELQTVINHLKTIYGNDLTENFG